MSLALYLIAHEDEDGTNWDLLIWAESPQQAQDMWFDSWEYESMPDDVRVFVIPTNPPERPSVLGWFTDVKKHERR